MADEPLLAPAAPPPPGPAPGPARRLGLAAATLLVIAGAAVAAWQLTASDDDGGGGGDDPLPQVAWPQRSMTFTNGKYCPDVNFSSPYADVSIGNIATIGANFVSVIVTLWQADINSTTIVQTETTATDADLEHVILEAHALGMSVMLKPQVDLTADPAHWRGDIGSEMTAAQFDDWFDDYSAWMVKYAALAQELGVEQFSIGCELIATTPQADHWRSVAADVRGAFGGVLTYSANWGGSETNLTWWDAVDVIGVDAYYPLLPDNPMPSVGELVAAWGVVIEDGLHDGYNGEYMTGGLANLTATWGMPLVFTEVGYCSTWNGSYASTTACTRDAEGQLPPPNMETQTRRYEAVVRAFADVEWFHGAHWWNWCTSPRFGGPDNTCCSPQGKPAQALLAEAYGGSNVVAEGGGPVCECIL